MCPKQKENMSDESVILVNLLKVKPGKQDALIALLKQNTDTVVRRNCPLLARQHPTCGRQVSALLPALANSTRSFIASRSGRSKIL